MAKIFSDEEIYSLVRECKASGLTEAQWCHEHGINPSTFYNWVSRLRKEAGSAPVRCSRSGCDHFAGGEHITAE